MSAVVCDQTSVYIYTHIYIVDGINDLSGIHTQTHAWRDWVTIRLEGSQTLEIVTGGLGNVRGILRFPNLSDCVISTSLKTEYHLQFRKFNFFLFVF